MFVEDFFSELVGINKGFPSHGSREGSVIRGRIPEALKRGLKTILAQARGVITALSGINPANAEVSLRHMYTP